MSAAIAVNRVSTFAAPSGDRAGYTQAPCGSVGARAFDSAASPAIFSENRLDFGGGRKLAAAHLRLGFEQVGLFLGRQHQDRLFVARISQQHAGGLLLHFEWERLYLLNGFFEQFSHVEILPLFGVAGEGKPAAILTRDS